MLIEELQKPQFPFGSNREVRIALMFSPNHRAERAPRWFSYPRTSVIHRYRCSKREGRDLCLLDRKYVCTNDLFLRSKDSVPETTIAEQILTWNKAHYIVSKSRIVRDQLLIDGPTLDCVNEILSLLGSCPRRQKKCSTVSTGTRISATRPRRVANTSLLCG